MAGLEPEVEPLTVEERSHLRRRWQATWPFAVVIGALVCLVVIPFITQRRTHGLWNELATVADPARALTTEIQLALALEYAGTQEYLQTANPNAARDHQTARARRHRAEARLLPLATRLGPSVAQPARALLSQLRPADALLDSLYAGAMTRQEYMRHNDQQRERFRDVVDTAGRIDQAIGSAADRIRLDIQTAERESNVVEWLLVVVALLASAVVARTARRQRTLAIRLDRRERWQTAFGDAARHLNASATARDVVQTLGTIAIDATGAYGFVVELARESATPGDVDVVARLRSGESRERRVHSGESVLSALAMAGGSETVVRTSQVAGALPAYLADLCESCTGLVTTVNSDGGMRAALVLLRRSGSELFAGADVPYLQALGDLASAAFQRVALLEALRESEERFRQIADNIREIVWLSDSELGKLFYVNSAYEEIWGRSEKSLYEDPLSLLDGVHADDRPRVAAALAGLRRGASDVEFRVVRPDGDVRWVWGRGFPVTNEHGEIYRVAGIIEDITERKLDELARRELLERERAARAASEAAKAEAEARRLELERVTESRVRLVRGFTHDVKNPLGAADGYLALLEDGIMGELQPSQRDGVARARRSIQHALELIRQILELARAEAGQLEIRRASMDPAAVVEEIVEEYRAQARDKGISLKLAPPDWLPPIESDASRVRQIAANLVSNAVKYTPAKGHVDVTIRVRSDGDAPGPGEWIAIDVSDDGPGIPADKQNMLFLEFVRFDPEAAHGAGIGLAISQRVAHALGGSITVRSAEGAGSRFTLWLPVRPAPE